jgi:HAD superfamily hydrolase (TIGR01509 family)
MIYRHIIWDVDGTLFDTYPAFTNAFSQAVKAQGAVIPLNTISNLAKESLSHCAETLARRYGLDLNQLMDDFSRIYAGIPYANQPPFPGVRKVCEQVLAGGGSNLMITHRSKSSTARLLAAHKMDLYFTDMITAESGFPRKPDPAAFQEMIRKHNLKLDETLAIGDREIDILAGQAAGVRTCLFGNADIQTSADMHITSFSQFFENLDQDT